MYASHMPVIHHLVKSMIACGNPENCIEFGAGWYSTPLIQACGGRTLEDDPVWYGIIGRFYPKIELVKSCLDGVQDRIYEFAFIDSKPENERILIAAKMRPYANTVVIHDANDCWEPEHGYIRELVPRWPFAYKFKGLDPATLILSRYEVDLGIPLERIKKPVA